MQHTESNSGNVDEHLALENIFYLSALSWYNSERRQLILDFYRYATRSGLLFERKISVDDITRYCKKHHIHSTQNTSRARMILDTYPLDLSGPAITMYSIERYSKLDSTAQRTIGISITGFIILEKALYDVVFFQIGQYPILQQRYAYKNRREYTDLCFLKEPDPVYIARWKNVILVNLEDVLKRAFDLRMQLLATHSELSKNVQLLPPPKEVLDTFIKEATQVLREISCPLSDLRRYFSEMGYVAPFLKPVLSNLLEESEYIVVPFPYLLNLTHFRIEELISKNKRLVEAEDKLKGKRTEFLVNGVIYMFPNRNIVKNFVYFAGEKGKTKRYESDALLILNKSLWVVESKSHPIFRRLLRKNDYEDFVRVFCDKVCEGFKQGIRTLRYIMDNPDVLKVLTEKPITEYTKGVIVALDGFLPTLFTQNKRVDSIFGTEKIYKCIENLRREFFGSERIRFYTITYLDLFSLTLQHDREYFEEFLLWRTKYLGRFPIHGYDELEYWAFFELFRNDVNVRKNFETLINNNSVVPYISARFNRKDYLRRIVSSESGNLPSN